jgi:hypothetical protein
VRLAATPVRRAVRLAVRLVAQRARLAVRLVAQLARPAVRLVAQLARPAVRLARPAEQLAALRARRARRSLTEHCRYLNEIETIKRPSRYFRGGRFHCDPIGFQPATAAPTTVTTNGRPLK